MKFIKYKLLVFTIGIVAAVALIIMGIISKGEELKNLSGVCIGVGSALFALSVANFITYMAERKHPEVMRKKNIEVNDERNTIIRDKAGAKTNNLVMWLIFVVLLVFILLDVELYVTLTMAGVVLINGILNVVYINYFNKKL